MKPVNIYLLSVYLRKWSYGENKLTLNYSYCTDSEYQRGQVLMKISTPYNLATDLMNRVFKDAKEKYVTNKGDKKVVLNNESDTLQKLSTFFTKINKEYNNNKRSRGKSKMINARSLDFYYNEFEYAPLSKDVKFFVHLSRGINKVNGDFFINAIDDFKKALKICPDNKLANKYLADSYIKVKKFDNAIKFLQKTIELDPTADNFSSLANIYVQIGEYKKSEDVLKRLDEIDPDSLISLYNKAILAYKQGKGYKSKLDKIYKADPRWLREKLLTDWDYKTANSSTEKNRWNAAIASKYLNFDKPYDLTKKAFNDEVPCYFNSESGIIRFVKEELEVWAELTNRYNLSEEKYSIHPENLDDSKKSKKTKIKSKKTASPKAGIKTAKKRTAKAS
jgi:tetratricopeptide (TPR) repeat protein